MPVDAVSETRAWVDRVVIGLNLCPFARAPQVRGRVRYALCETIDPGALREALLDELRYLVDAPESEVETTLLIHPRVLGDFDDYNEFVGEAEDCIAALDLEGFVQLATFHPRYRFAGTADDDLGNATNRSPHPVLQLIRETSMDRAVAAIPDPAAIYAVNIATMEGLGAEGWAALCAACRADAIARDRARPASST